MNEAIKFIINVLVVTLYIVGVYIIGSRVGVDLIKVLWNAGMQWEAAVTGFIVWQWLISSGLRVVNTLFKVLKEVK